MKFKQLRGILLYDDSFRHLFWVKQSETSIQNGKTMIQQSFFEDENFFDNFWATSEKLMED